MKTVSAALQIVLAVVGWVAFALVWYWVFWTRTGVYEGWRAVLLIVLIAGALVFVTLLWVRYNVGIYRRKGARTAVPRVIHDYSRDSRGVPVRADLGGLRSSRYVVVSLSSEGDSPVKTYAAGSTELTDDEVTACTL